MEAIPRFRHSGFRIRFAPSCFSSSSRCSRTIAVLVAEVQSSWVGMKLAPILATVVCDRLPTSALRTDIVCDWSTVFRAVHETVLGVKSAYGRSIPQIWKC